MEKVIVVRNPHGLHARPAAKFVRAASSVQEEVTIEKNGKTANAKSILGIMSLGVSRGDSVKLFVNAEEREDLMFRLEEILTAEDES
jgi:phosphotransferase system HPr (HPr) family protein